VDHFVLSHSFIDVDMSTRAQGVTEDRGSSGDVTCQHQAHQHNPLFTHQYIHNIATAMKTSLAALLLFLGHASAGGPELSVRKRASNEC
jgi:hypothetical protein